MSTTIIKEKTIKDTHILPEYQGEHDAFYIRSKEEFIEMIWRVVQKHRVGPIGMGNWNQKGAKEHFFDEKGYMSYLKREGLVNFIEEDWYVVQWDREAQLDFDDRVFYVTRLRDINIRHARYIKQLLG